MKVSEIMTKNPVCCWPSSSTLSAALLMQETDAGIVPVIQDPFTPRLVGVVTDRDLCLYVVAAGRGSLIQLGRWMYATRPGMLRRAG